MHLLIFENFKINKKYLTVDLQLFNVYLIFLGNFSDSQIDGTFCNLIEYFLTIRPDE